MGPLIALVVAAMVAFTALAVWRGRLVSIALAAAECPDCRVPLVPLSAHGAGAGFPGPVPLSTEERAEEGRSNWEICACPRCDRVVTTVGRLPSPVADCPSCRQRSLVVYAERVDGEIVVDEWCDMCGRRGRIALPDLRANAAPLGPDGGREGRVLPFRRS
ncbi:MAG: hypothetical protein R3F59_01365 [Myxococcota bacterium]